MSQYRFLQSNGRRYVYANAAKLSETVAVSQEILSPRSLAPLRVYVDKWSINEPFIYTPPECEKACPLELTLAVSVQFSGPLVSKAQKLSLLARLAASIAADQFGTQLDGFPPNVNNVYTI